MTKQVQLVLWYGGDLKKRVPEAEEREFHFTNRDGINITEKLWSVELISLESFIATYGAAAVYPPSDHFPYWTIMLSDTRHGGFGQK